MVFDAGSDEMASFGFEPASHPRMARFALSVPPLVKTISLFAAEDMGHPVTGII